MIAKILDAGSMLWAAFDPRERLFALWAVMSLAGWLVGLMVAALASRARAREEQLAKLVAERLAADAA